MNEFEEGLKKGEEEETEIEGTDDGDSVCFHVVDRDDEGTLFLLLFYIFLFFF